jgi:WD40 repeat protein
MQAFEELFAVSGAENGEVKVWNFSSGACICVLRPKTHEEVTAVLTFRSALFRHFLVAGWDRRITCYEDAGPSHKESFPGRVIQGHKVRSAVHAGHHLR